MAVLDWLKNLFAKKENSVLATELLPSSPIEESLTNSLVLENSDVTFPHWLLNEDALRDEGVIFGLTETKAEEKIKIIEALFSQKAVASVKKKEELSEKIGELNLLIEKHHGRIEAIIAKSDDRIKKSYEEENVVRVSMGLLLSLGMCAGNYFLISQSLKGSFPENHDWISWGIFLTGMFSLYRPISVLHSTTSTLNWKTALEEFGLPLAASAFVFVQTIGNQPFYKSLALFFFVLFMFVVSGKIVLSSIAKLKSECGAFSRNWQLKIDKKNADTIWQTEKEVFEKAIDDLRIEKWKILPEMNRLEAEILKINGEKDTLIHIFQSEFQLAQSFKTKLSGHQIKNIVEQ
jgi:hypothetical protein